jgi:uncharacterized surface protein with fasciclin (FAS1) repeats
MGPFTVFAPSNAAFAKLPAATLNALLADKAALTRVLTYHVVTGKVLAAQVVNFSTATTLQGQNIAIRVMNGVVLLNESAQVIATDIEASNGVVHLIDTVLMPPSLQTIANIAVATPDLSTLVAALSAANLVNTFQGAGPFTVFAPSNAAFAKLPAATLNALLADTAALTRVLTYHVVAGKVMAARFATINRATTLLGSDITIGANRDGAVFVNGITRVLASNIEASNGVVHVIDTVLMPPSVSTGSDVSTAVPGTEQQVGSFGSTEFVGAARINQFCGVWNADRDYVIVSVRVGNGVDYYRPFAGKTLCQMLQTPLGGVYQHLENGAWVEVKSTHASLLGGVVAPNDGTGRSHASYWGSRNASLTGACSANNGALSCSNAFSITVGRLPTNGFVHYAAWNGAMSVTAANYQNGFGAIGQDNFSARCSLYDASTGSTGSIVIRLTMGVYVDYLKPAGEGAAAQTMCTMLSSPGAYLAMLLC